MGWRSSVLIVILVFGILFSLLYSARFVEKQQPEVLTPPKLSEYEALDIVVSDLKARMGEHYGGLSIYNTNEGFMSYEEIQLIGSGKILNATISEEFYRRNIELNEPLRFRLFYMHPNGTQFNIDSANHTILTACHYSEEECSPSQFYADYAIARSVYLFDVLVRASDGQSIGEAYVVDANTGEIVFSFISKKPDGLAQEWVNKYYERQ